jgi:hypothetical protein
MSYEDYAHKELMQWQKKMMRRPSLMNHLSKRLQVKMNNLLPEKVHVAITSAIKQMIRAVLFGAKQINRKPSLMLSLQKTEQEVEILIENY